MKYNYEPDYEYNCDKEWEFAQKFNLDVNYNENYKIIDYLKGSYTNNLYIGKEETWNIHEARPEYVRPCKNVIPSDGRFREDLIWLYRALNCAKNNEEEKIYMDISQEWKVMMENFNRWERKHRTDFKAKMKKQKKKNL